MRTLAQMPGVKYSLTRFGGGTMANGVSYPGGLDLTTPALALQPGAVRAGLNFECSTTGGYSRIAGYERKDGRARPSDATYTIVQFTAFTTTPAVGDTISQATSGATGKVIAVVSSPTPYVAITQVSGTFDTTHLVSDGGNPVGTPTSTTVMVSAQVRARYLALAADVYRALIGAVPGSGSVLGVVGMTFSGTDYVYAFRNNSGGTAVDLYKTSGSGWTQVSFYKIVEFTAGGTATPVEGDVLTKGGVTATVKRVMTRSGAWAGTAAGAFVITTPSGGNFSAGAATSVGSGATVTLSGIQTSITLSPNGHFEFDKANFSGAGASKRIYGCDGVNLAFEFDGDVLAPITSGFSAPTHIRAHKNFLFLSQGSSMGWSAVGFPFKWTSTDGAGEIATGDTVTGFLTLPGNQSAAALAVFQQGNASILYGLANSDFTLVSYNSGFGGQAYSAQNLFDTFVFDDLGIICLETTLAYGNFESSLLTRNILPFTIQERSKLICSSVHKEKNQYRVFFNDGYALYVTKLNKQYLGSMPMLFPNPPTCMDLAENTDGSHSTYFGSSTGYVYELDKGTSFDGSSIDAYITLAWDALKSPRVRKRFRAASIEVQGDAYAAFQVGYSFSYASSLAGQPGLTNVTSSFTQAPAWDSFTWDSFTWDGVTVSPSDMDMVGTAENVQVTISAFGDASTAPFTVPSILYHYTPRRGMRV